MSEIHIGEVKMPLNDFVVSRNAILGITKSGKTYTAKGVAEQLLEHKVPIIVFDAIGVWRYLKVPDKRRGGKGFQVVVAGGSHPDLPLTPHSAPEIVRAAIRENIPLVIDLYDAKLSKADWRRIVQDCFRILLYENKGLRHIFLEESAEYAPQRVVDGQTYAEVEKLARMGGNASLGITFINQRAQELNKAVLELCDNIILLRQRGTHAIDSLEKQMDKLSPDMAVEIAKSMPHMTQGDCWIFTENDEKPVRTRSGLIKSFHPDRRNPDEKQIAQTAVDTGQFVAALSGKLEKVIAEAKANDPSELRRKLAHAEAELKKAKIITPAPAKVGKTEIKNVSFLTDADRKHISKSLLNVELLEASIRTNCEQTQKTAIEVQKHLEGLYEKLLAGKLFVPDALPRKIQTPVSYPPRIIRTSTIRPAPEPPSVTDGEIKVGKCERAILTALAQYPQGRTTNQVSILSGYTEGGMKNALSQLRTAQYIDRGQPIKITDAGLEALGQWTPLPTGQDLQAHWIQKLGKCESAILHCLLTVHPNGLVMQELVEKTGYTEGGMKNALSRLRTLELMTRGQPMRASDEFFQ